MIGLLACTSVVPIEAVEDSGAIAEEAVPGAADSAPRALTAPGAVTLSCPGAIPDTGKTGCTGSFTWEDGDPAWEGAVGVGYHGRSSAGFPKRQYAIELREADGTDAMVDLYGLGADGDWLLNGMYIDRAMYRTQLAFDLFRDLGGGWAPDTAYVELTLHGALQGLYLLTERVERGEFRIDMPADTGAGDFFVVKGDETGIASALQYASWAVLEPRDASAGQYAGVSSRLSEWEAALTSADPWTSTDLHNFSVFVLVEELLKNNDAYFLSHHAWRGADGIMRMVPWDVDLTLGQPYYNDNSLSSLWIAYRPALIASPALTDAFRSELVATWTEARRGVLGTESVLARLRGYRAFMGDSVDRNWEVWAIEAVQFAGDQLYPVSSPEEEYAAVEAWIVARLAWMDENLAAY